MYVWKEVTHGDNLNSSVFKITRVESIPLVNRVKKCRMLLVTFSLNLSGCHISFNCVLDKVYEDKVFIWCLLLYLNNESYVLFIQGVARDQGARAPVRSPASLFPANEITLYTMKSRPFESWSDPLRPPCRPLILKVWLRPWKVVFVLNLKANLKKYKLYNLGVRKGFDFFQHVMFLTLTAKANKEMKTRFSAFVFNIANFIWWPLLSFFRYKIRFLSLSYSISFQSIQSQIIH